MLQIVGVLLIVFDIVLPHFLVYSIRIVII